MDASAPAVGGGSTVAQAMAAYFSRLEAADLAVQGRQTPEAMLRPRRGALMFLDITGFTPLTQKLDAEGPQGAETLQEVLGSLFRPVLEHSTRRGGDALAFMGDAVQVFWEAKDDGDEAMAAAIGLALQAAAAIQEEHQDFEPRPGLFLHMRISVSSGTLLQYRLGGVAGAWRAMFTGEAIREVNRADKACSPGWIVTTEAAWRLVSTRCRGEVLDGGAVRLLSVETPWEEQAPSVGQADPETVPLMRRLLPRAVAERIIAGHQDFLSEFRSLTVMFVKLLGVDADSGDSLASLDAAVHRIQEQLDRFGGALKSIERDDKGSSALVLFGLPMESHDDDSVRAVSAAMAIRDGWREHGGACAIGLATGRLFCGDLGASDRRVYALLGPAINLAARLTSKAGENEIICDAATAQSAERRLRFERLPDLTLKGIAEPVEAFRPTTDTTDQHDKGMVVPRHREMALLEAAVGATPGPDRDRVFLISGEAGLGKSTLLDEFLRRADSLGAQVLRGTSDAIEDRTAYFALRSILAQALGVSGELDPADGRRRVLEMLDGREDLREWVPLLNAVLPLGFEDNDATAQMGGDTASTRLRAVLVALLEEAVRGRRTILAVEDLHWLDEGSMAVLVEFAEQIPDLMLVLTTRPMDEKPEGYADLVEGPGRKRLDLRGLDSSGIAEVVAACLEVESVSHRLAEHILERGDGNPLFSEELALAMAEAGLVEIRGDRAELAARRIEKQGTIPDSLQGIITSRIDRLEQAEHLTLLVCSVIGRVFELALVHAVYPLRDKAAEVERALSGLVTARLVEAVDGAPSTYRFRHALICDTSYESLPFAQRRDLHRNAAESLEERHRDDPGPICARLAHHFQRADLNGRALPYVSMAGDRALAAYANRDAAELFERALEIDTELRGPLNTDLQRAAWRRKFAEAHYSIVDYEGAIEGYEDAISLAGFRRFRKRWRLLTEVLIHIWYRWRPGPGRGGERDMDDEERQRHLSALVSIRDLTTAYSWRGDMVAVLHLSILAANIAFRVGPSAESAYAHTALALVLSFFGMSKVAERDMLEAREMATRFGQLTEIAVTNISLGMFLVMQGRFKEAVEPLEVGDEAAQGVGAGLWKHRAKFQLGEVRIFTGDFEKMRDAFAAAEELALGAEETVPGAAVCMQAQALYRLGRLEEALELAAGPRGLSYFEDNPSVILEFGSLGAAMEIATALGKIEQALEYAGAARVLQAKGDDVNIYFFGLHGHYGLAEVYLTLWQRRLDGDDGPGLPPLPELQEAAKTTLKGFAKFLKRHPGSLPRYRLVHGRYLALLGQTDDARRTLAEAAEAAARFHAPYSEAMALRSLAELSEGEERSELLDRAAGIFERLSMGHELERTRAMATNPPTARP